MRCSQSQLLSMRCSLYIHLFFLLLIRYVLNSLVGAGSGSSAAAASDSTGQNDLPLSSQQLSYQRAYLRLVMGRHRLLLAYISGSY